MTDEMKRVTVCIDKRGRKYFSCTAPKGYGVKLVINEHSEKLEIGKTVTIPVIDRSKHTQYGVTVIYAPINDDLYNDTKEEKNRARWLSWARKDLHEGRYSSNAINKAIELLASVGEREELDELKARREDNEVRYKQKKAEREAQRAKERAESEKRRAEARKNRIAMPVDIVPDLNIPVKLNGKVVVVTGYGTSWYINEDTSSIWHSCLGHEGELACYCYYRDATGEEIAQLETQGEIHETNEPS